MNRIVEPGQLLSGRYQLTQPFLDQTDQAGAEFWSAKDTLLGKPVRVLALDPQAPTTQPVLDAARRSALVDDSHLVRVLSVGDSPDVAFVTLEIPKGQQLSNFSKKQLSGEETWNILGTLSQALVAAQARGLRHYHVTPEDVWVTPDGSIALDGVGISAALAGWSVSEVPDPDADREQAHRLLGFGAGLLSGNFPNADDDVDSSINEALSTPDLPEPLRAVFSRELEGDGTPNPRSIVRGLGTWPSVTFGEPRVSSDAVPEAPSPQTPGPQAPKRKSAFGSDRFFSASRVREDSKPSVEKFPKITAPLGGDAAGDNDVEVAGSPAPVSLWGGPKPQTPESPEEPESTGATAIFQKIVDPEEDKGEKDEYYARAASAGFAAGLASERESLQKEEVIEPETEAAPEVEEQQAPSEPEPEREPEAAPEPDVEEEDAPEPAPEVEPEPEEQWVPAESEPEAEAEPEPEPEQPTEQVPRVAAAVPVLPDKPVTPAQPTGGQPPAGTHRTASESEPDRHYNPSKVFTIGTAILVAIAFIWAAVTLFKPTTTPETQAPVLTPTATAEATDPAPAETTAEPTEEPTEDYPDPAIDTVTLLNPEAAALDASNVSEQDSPTTIGNAYDGNTSTAWRSWWYSSADFVGKTGLGLAITLDEETEVSEVTLAVNGSGGNVQWRDTTDDSPSDGDVLAEGSMSSETTLKADEPLVTKTIILWFNSLPTDDEGNYRISISEITVK